jgi:carboxylesterase
VKKRLGTVRQPALVIHPRDDDMASLKNAQYLQTHLAGMVETVVLEDSYHIITLDQQRHVVVERTADFVERVARRRAAAAEGRAAREKLEAARRAQG